MKNDLAICNITYPFDVVKLEAVKRNGYNIRYIFNPSEKLCIESLKTTWNSKLYNFIIINFKDILTDNFYKEINRLKLKKGLLYDE